MFFVWCEKVVSASNVITLFRKFIIEQLGHFVVISNKIIKTVFEVEDILGEFSRVSSVVYSTSFCLFRICFFKDAPYEIIAV